MARDLRFTSASLPTEEASLAGFSKKKLVLAVGVLEVATLLFAGNRAARLYAQPRMVPVESIFPEARAGHLNQPVQFPIAAPAVLRKQAPEKPDPKMPITTKVFSRAPKAVM
jgi:hypothetical protein